MNLECYNAWHLAMETSLCLLRSIGCHETDRSIVICANLLISDSIELRNQFDAMQTEPGALELLFIFDTQVYVDKLVSLTLDICNLAATTLKGHALMLYACVCQFDKLIENMVEGDEILSIVFADDIRKLKNLPEYGTI